MKLRLVVGAHPGVRPLGADTQVRPYENTNNRQAASPLQTPTLMIFKSRDNNSDASQPDWPFLLGLGLVGLVLFFYRLGAPGLMDPDEGRYAEIAREFFVLKDWLIPHLNLLPYLEKPPLVYWLTALSFKALGYTEAAARLPSAVSALGGVFLAYGLGRALWGPGPGVLGALVLASTAGYVALGRILTLDMTFALYLNLGIGLGYLALSRGQDRLWPWAYLALALAVLTKGPVALVLAGLVWVIWGNWFTPTPPSPSRGREPRKFPFKNSLVMAVISALVLGAPGGHHPAVVCLRAVALPGVFPVLYPGAAPGPVFDPGHPPRASLLLRPGAPGAAAALDLAPPLDAGGRGPVAGPGLPVPGDLGGGDRGLFLPVPGEAGALHPAGALTSGAAGGTRPGPAHRGGPAVLQQPVAQDQPAGLGLHGRGAGGAQFLASRRLWLRPWPGPTSHSPIS